MIFSIKKILSYVKLNKSTTDRELVFRMHSFQICLCRKRACGLFTENGLCTVCDWCHFFCTEEDQFIYDQAVKKFLATKQPQPFCCMTGDLVRTRTQLRVNTDPESPYFGRPFFVCSKKIDPCRYFAWGDKAIVPSPLCEHGKPCRKEREWRDGPNKGRYFFSCAEPASYPDQGRCKFFKWMEAEDEREIDEDTSAEFLRLNDEFPHYTNGFMILMMERQVGLTNIHQEYMKIVRTKESLKKRL